MARKILLKRQCTRKYLWAEVVKTVLFVRNRLVMESCEEISTPYEVIHGMQPYLSNLCKFACNPSSISQHNSAKENSSLSWRL